MPTTNYHTVNGEIIGESTGGVLTNYLSDGLGSVVATVNSAATVVNTYAYKPSGARLAKTGAGADPRFQHVGSHGIVTSTRIHAEEYMRRRHYSNLTGAYTTRDPSAHGTEFGVPYIYVRQNPTTLIDPSGLQPEGARRRCDVPVKDPFLEFVDDYFDRCKGCEEDPCGWAKRQPFKDKYLGYVVCCNGVLTACYGNAEYWNGLPRGDKYHNARICVAKHEEEHKKQCEIHPWECRCNYPRGDGRVESPCGKIGFRTIDQSHRNECGGFKATVRCMSTLFIDECINEPNGPYCELVCHSCRRMREECKGWFNVPQNLQKYCDRNCPGWKG